MYRALLLEPSMTRAVVMASLSAKAVPCGTHEQPTLTPSCAQARKCAPNGASGTP